MAVTRVAGSRLSLGFRRSSRASGPTLSTIFSASGGDEVKTIGIYKYHLFSTAGNSTFSVSSTNEQTGSQIEIAVIGAGGGGGRGEATVGSGGAGGGAKEPATGYTTQFINPGSHTVTIASGGLGATTVARGETPSLTSFFGTSTISALGGGGGGTWGFSNGSGGTGGSGGGGSYADNNGGAASGSNTNAGGQAFGRVPGNQPNFGGGGGGGATAAGVDGTGSVAGNGGQGLLLTDIDSNLTSGNFTTLSGMTRVCSGGGGGSRSGSGGTGGTGAGNGSHNELTPGGNATSFGSGGGGGGTRVNPSGAASGGNGFRGLVIIRYLA